MHLVEQKRLIAFSFVFYHCLILSASSLAPSSQTWRREPALDDKMVNADQYDASDHTLVVTSSKARCAAACGQLQTCQSFFFSKRSGHCHLHADVFWGDSDSTEEGGVRYYTASSEEEEETVCPLSLSYTKDSSSGICYKFYNSDVNLTTAEARCAADGARLIKPDSVEKVQAVARILYDIYGDGMSPHYWISARRPQAEWYTPWTENSSFYEWYTTGESLMPFYQEGYFYETALEHFVPAYNCVYFKPVYANKSNQMSAFVGFGCDWSGAALCEIV